MTPRRRFPFSDIRGPMFLDCGTDDSLWTSCAYALRIVNRRRPPSRFAYPHVLYRYLRRRATTSTLVPYSPANYPAYRPPAGQGNTLLQTPMPMLACGRSLLSFLVTHTAVGRHHPPPRDHSCPASRPVEFADTPHRERRRCD